MTSHTIILFAKKIDTGKVDVQANLMVDLLVVSDLYLVLNLKEQVERALIDAINLENISSLEQLANTHNCNLLLQHCKLFREKVAAEKQREEKKSRTKVILS